MERDQKCGESESECGKSETRTTRKEMWKGMKSESEHDGEGGLKWFLQE